MIIGSLGDVSFVVARSLVRTFRDYSREGNGRWAKHDLIGQKPVLEFLGKDIEKISFTMVFRADQGINPEKEAQKLRKMRDNGEIMVLILADKPVGDNSWVIESLGESVTFWDAFGNIQSMSVDVSLQEYVERLVI